MIPFVIGAAAVGVLAVPSKIPAPPPVPPEIVVSRTDRVVEGTADPIWSVQLLINGRVVDQLDALSGRASRQGANRHTAGNKSPLPIGPYDIGSSEISGPPFTDPELGSGYWIPVFPRFRTGRSALGIHHDPSWGRANGESGTSGCIGLRTPQDTARLTGWIRQHGIQRLSVVS